MTATPQTSGLPTRYCVVGGGPSGLIAARALLRVGIEVDVFERHDKTGGIWNIEQPGSPMYESCNFISSKQHSGFVGFRMGEELPDYPNWKQIRSYIADFVEAYDLERHVTLGTAVQRAEPVRTPAGTYWTVTLSTGERRDYRGVVWACGQQWFPFVPDLPGQEDFRGRIIHSRDYTRRQEFVGKKVVVVGAGNSGVDIACDAAVHGEAAYLSMRRGYWFFPKSLYGQPVGDFLDRSAKLPPGYPDLHQMDDEEVRQFVLAVVGDLSHYGLPVPNHPAGATHPVINNQVLHFISHGWLAAKPDIARLHPDGVEFTDGSTVDADVIVLATGFEIEIPWLDRDLLDWDRGHPLFHLGTIAKNVEGLYAVGLIHFADNAYAVFDQLAQLMAADAAATVHGTNADNVAFVKNHYDPDLKGGFPFLDVRRNVLQMDVPTLKRTFEELRTRFDIPIPTEFDDEFYAAQLRGSENT